MNDPALYDGKEYGHYPEKNDHPILEIAIIPAVVFGPEKGRYCQDGCRETANEQDDVVVAEETGLVGVMGAKKPPLIFEEFVDKPGATFYGLVAIPGGSHQKCDNEEEQGIAPVKIELKAIVDEVGTKTKQEDHQGYLPLHEHGEPHKNTGPDDVIELAVPQTLLVEFISLPMVENKIIEGEKGKEVEPGVDDP